MANMVCFFAARAAGADWDVRADGVNDGTRPRAARVRLGGDPHVDSEGGRSVRHRHQRASDGFPPTRRSAWTSRRSREQVADDRAAGDLPFIVVGTAGSVSTGAVDPLRGDRRVLPASTASGSTSTAPTAGSPRRCPTRRPICGRSRLPTRSPSIRTSGCTRRSKPGARWFATPTRCARAFSYHPPYYHFDEQATNFVDFGPQNSRGFRALKVWLALRQAGASGYRRMIADDIALSRAMARGDGRAPGARTDHPGAQHHHVPLRARRSARPRRVQRWPSIWTRLNRALLDALQRGGEAFVSNAVVPGRYVLRACIVNFHTTLADVQAVPEIVRRAGAG